MRLSTRLWKAYVFYKREQDQQLSQLAASERARNASKIRWSTRVEEVEPKQNQAVLLSGVRAKAGRKGMWSRWERERAIESYMPELRKIARSLQAHMFSHVDLEELSSSGAVGLVKAANKYDPSSGPFAPYAYFKVRGAIIDAHRRRAYTEETHSSLDEMRERTGRLPAHLDTDHSAAADGQLRRKELLAIISAAMLQLPLQERELLSAHAAGESLASTCEYLGMSAPAARARLTMAKAKVAAAIRGLV